MSLNSSGREPQEKTNKMNMPPNGTICTGAPGSIAAELAVTTDAAKGLLIAVEAVMDDLAFHIQTGRFRPSDSTVVKLTALKDQFNAVTHLVY